MQPAIVFFGIVTLGISACAPKYRFPTAIYGRDLKQPHTLEMATGEKVPCGKGVLWAVGDRLLSCTIDRHATYQRHDFPAGAELWFRWDGTLEWASYVEYQEAPAHRKDFHDMRVIGFDLSGYVATSSRVERRQETTTEPAARNATAK